jgi:hypothetical protein
VDFTALKAELVARGFDSLSTTRQGYYINAARAELDRMFLWPWREKSASGTSPLSVSDLGRIEKVTNSSQSALPLAKADRSTLIDIYGDLSVSGTPGYYYVAWPSGTPTVVAIPVSTNTIAVQYWKVTVDLSGAADVPAAPSEAHYTIVDLAVRRAYRDSDDHAAAAALQPEIDNAVAQLLEQYPPGQPAGPDGFVGVTGASEDW